MVKTSTVQNVPDTASGFFFFFALQLYTLLVLPGSVLTTPNSVAPQLSYLSQYYLSNI